MDFTLEKWSKEHVDGVYKNANNFKIAEKLRDIFPYPYTYEDAKWYVNDCIEKNDEHQICRAIVLNKEAIGSIGIFVKNDVHKKCGELGYWLGEDFWGKNIMTNAVKQICKIAFEKFDLERIYAEPFANNIGSRRVLEKAGFNLEGIMKNSVFKNGNIYDSCMYALLKNNL